MGKKRPAEIHAGFCYVTYVFIGRLISSTNTSELYAVFSAYVE